MKKLSLCIVFCLAMGGFALAQSKFSELERAKRIKLLEATREEVRRIFTGYPFSSSSFAPADNALIRVSYSIGDCSSDFEDWNVGKDIAEEITIELRRPSTPQDLGIDLSGFVKEKQFKNVSTAFVYHKKDEGIAYYVDEGKVWQISLTPPKEKYDRLCDNERVKRYYSGPSWFTEKLKERRYQEGDSRPYAEIGDVTMSQTEVILNCPSADAAQPAGCPDKKIIIVEAKGSSTDPTDVLTFKFEVSGGRIIGKGARIEWDLSGVPPGTYTIVAGVENGCGICGRWKKEVVVVREFVDGK